MKYPVPQGATEVEILDPKFTIGIPPIDPNQPPTADAGSDFTITLPIDTIRLLGRGTDPEGNAVSFKWSKLSGAAASIMSPNAANTDVAGLSAGTYSFRLTVTDDKGQTKTDDVNGTVKPAATVPPPSQPGKYEGFGVAAASVVNQSNIINVSSKAQFDAALGSNRIIRFTAPVSMVNRVYLGNHSNLWIDANGFDVTIDNNMNGDGLSIGGNSHHIILSGLRVINAGNDGINVVDSANNIIIINCSSYDNRDGNIDIAGGQNISVIGCIGGRIKTGGAGIMLITSQLVTIARNLLNPLGSPSEGERCPFVHCNYSPAANPNADIRNNVIMNWGRSGGSGSGYGTAIGYNAVGNVVNNFYSDKESANSSVCNGDGYGTAANGKIYSAGNHITNGSSILSASMANNRAEITIPAANKVSLLTALEAKAKVKAEVGPAVKNSYEQSLINAIP